MQYRCRYFFQMDLLNMCKICFQHRQESFSIFNKFCDKNLCKIINNICDIQINNVVLPNVIICRKCAEALLQAETIIETCRKSLSALLDTSVKEELLDLQEHNLCHELDEPTKVCEENLIAIKSKIEPCVEFLSTTVDVDDINKEVDDTEDYEVEEQESSSKTEFPSTTVDVDDINTSFEEVDDAEDYEEEELESSSKTEPNKRKYKRKKMDRRVLKINTKADWHFKCELCSFESDFAAYYRRHLIDVHQLLAPKIFKCHHCDESYQRHHSLGRHIAVVHEQKALPTRARNTLCSECGKKFTCQSSLKLHMHIHTGEPLPFKCDDNGCNKSFASMASLQYHKTSRHTQEKKFACEICGNKFALIFSLRNHISKCHMSNELQDCPNCGRSYRSLKKYEEHILSEICKNWVHPCQFPNCSKRFSTPSKMRIHMLNQH